MGAVKPALKTVSYLVAKVILYPVLLLYFRVRVEGDARLPRKGGLLLAANHFSYVDPLILGCMLPRRLWFVMAEDQFEKPFLKTFSRLMDVIPIKAGAAFRIGPIKKCLSLLKGGRVVAIFPEGRRSNTGKLLPPMPGVGVLAVRAGTPIIPIAIVGTPHRFRTKRQLWSYAGLGVITRNSGEWISDAGTGRIRRSSRAPALSTTSPNTSGTYERASRGA